MPSIKFKDLGKQVATVVTVNSLENEISHGDEGSFKFDAEAQEVRILIEPFKIISLLLTFN